jgi:ketosteroid isomerase-like protein
VEAWHEALNKGDVDALTALTHADVEVGGPRGAGRGADLLRQWVGRAGIRIEPGRIFHRPGTVVVEGRASWGSGESEDGTGVQTVGTVFVLREDKIARIVRYPDLATALAAAHLDESSREDSD